MLFINFKMCSRAGTVMKDFTDCKRNRDEQGECHKR